MNATKKKKLKRSPIYELSLYSKPKVGDESHSNAIIPWFQSLSPSMKKKVLYTHNPNLASFVRQMFIKKIYSGEMEFGLLNDQNIESRLPVDTLEENFYSRKKSIKDISPENKKFTAEKYIEKVIRLADTEESWDTIAIDPDINDDYSNFLESIFKITNEKAFKTPCRVVWDQQYKKWNWEYPVWLEQDSKFKPLSAWAIAGIERSLWSKYWLYNKIDPRRHGEIMHYQAEESESETISNGLRQFWTSLSDIQRFNVIGSIEEVTRIFQQEKQERSNLNKVSFDDLKQPIARPMIFYGQHSGPGQQLSSERIQFYQMNNQSVESIFDVFQTSPPEKLIDFLSLSPLDRATTAFDYVTRKILSKISEAYAERKIEDLLSDELTKKTKIQDKKKKKKKKKPKNQKIEEKNETEQKVEEEAFVNELMGNIMTGVYKNLDVEEDKTVIETHENDENGGFTTVEVQKRAPKTPVKNKRRIRNNKKIDPKKPRTNNHNIDSKGINKEQNKVQVQWQTVTANIKTQPPHIDEFPPLSVQSLQASDPSYFLHHEILQFGSEMVRKASSRFPEIKLTIDKLEELVKVLHPGAYIEIYGSHASGLALENSDLDIAIMRSGITGREGMRAICQEIGGFLENCKWVRSCQIIDSATVPVVKLEIDSNIEPLKVDITIDDSDDLRPGRHLGLKTLALTKELLQKYKNLQYLALVLKNLLQVHNLNSAYLGGLGSYALLLWIVARIISLHEYPENLGELLISFLKFYGNEFNPKTMGIYIDNLNPFFELPPDNFEAVVTRDPATNTNVTRTSYNIQEVLNLFSWAYKRLKELLDKGKTKDLLNQIYNKFEIIK